MHQIKNKIFLKLNKGVYDFLEIKILYFIPSFFNK